MTVDRSPFFVISFFGNFGKDSHMLQVFFQGILFIPTFQVNNSKLIAQFIPIY